MKIKKIVIQSESGYCPVDYVYKDSLEITSESIEYVYKPYIESETNPLRKWKYTTNSPIYTHLYNQISKMTSEVLNFPEEYLVLDAGETIVTVFFEDGHKESKNCTFRNETVIQYFRLIKKLIPDTEYMPVVLISEEEEN